jgi:hypothetical protein
MAGRDMGCGPAPTLTRTLFYTRGRAPSSSPISQRPLGSAKHDTVRPREAILTHVTRESSGASFRSTPAGNFMVSFQTDLIRSLETSFTKSQSRHLFWSLKKGTCSAACNMLNVAKTAGAADCAL